MLVGIVGKANVGKSTFFKAATMAEVEIANRPFVTIHPNEGVGHVKVECVGKEFNVECNPKFGYCINNKRFVPIKILDVAGLVPGAHEGKGLGLSFLDDLREADALIHIVDVSGSTNEQGEPVAVGSYDPANDVRFLEVELDMWYLQILKKGWERFARQVQQEKKEIHKALAKQLSALKVTENMMLDTIKKFDISMDPTKWGEKELMQIAAELRKKTKPMVIAANKVDLPGAAENLIRLQEEFPDMMLVACSAEAELALREAARKGIIDYTPGEKGFEVEKEGELNEKQKQALEFIKASILGKFGSTGVQETLDITVFKILGYIAAYPVANSRLEDKDGNKLPDCLLISQGTTALEFAFKVHTTLGEKFIKAINLKTKKIIGKDYVVRHRDVIEIVSG